MNPINTTIGPSRIEAARFTCNDWKNKLGTWISAGMHQETDETSRRRGYMDDALRAGDFEAAYKALKSFIDAVRATPPKAL